MSGRKRIRVDESEWYRLQRQAQQLKEVRRDLPHLIEEVRQQTRADVDQAFGAAQERARRAEQVLAGLSEQTRQLEAATSRRLQEQAAQLRHTVEATAGQLRAEVQARLDAQQDVLRREIADERAARRKEFDHLSQQVGELTADRERAGEVARIWVDDARTVERAIAQELPHERFAPGELDRLRTRLATAESNVAQGRHDAAIALSQETYHALSELRLEVAQRDLAHRAARAGAVQALVTVDHLIRKSAVRPVLGADGEVLDGVRLEVDYWSEGELEEVRQAVERLLARARDEDTGVDELTDLQQREAPRLEQWLGDVVERAGMRQLASQVRVNLADAVVGTLEQIAAYDLVDGVYDASDPRRAFLAKLQHENGNEILIEVDRAPEHEAQCVLRVLSYDHDTASKSELRERALSIQRALREEGHDASEPVSDAGVPDRAALDLQRRRSAPAARVELGRERASGGRG
ncbi:hypothetical protein [Streptomyces mangrovisoli]|uniref:Uncharacterized protein n=1 Tax=Streptomyces mangrovisoli TaxID=1428628 RepID=A0A1J4NND2_9ACTN|nr:hypothetical protein [Streptomyces mangrovisoli]OIJ62789.1 hypothetical protein WN71_037580 [Streptomyces mangrovisoli]